MMSANNDIDSKPNIKCSHVFGVKQVKLEFVFYVKTDVSPLLVQFHTESQVLVQQRGINSESKYGT